MRSLKILPAILVLSVMPVTASAQQPMSPSEVVDKIISQEQVEVQLLRQYSPLVETYIQNIRPDKQLGAVPDGDKYFLGRADLAKGVELEPLEHDAGMKHNPLPKSGKGRFVGRIWVEDQDYHIVRFNGAYGGSSLTSYYFNFDSWRTNSEKNLWLPAYVYSEEGSVRDAKTKSMRFKAFRAQTRLWGYDLGNVREEQELSKVLVEGPNPVNDQSESANDYSPFQAERSWDRLAEDNVTERLERQGLMAPHGEVDKVLETVVNNLEVTNNLDIQPEVRCRVLMTTTLESFTIGHTIVLSRGLIDVLPDEASLAAVVAHELGHVVLGHRMDSQFAFFNRVRFDEKETFRHFDFARTPEEEQSAKRKGIELLSNSPYKEQSGTAQLFLQALKNRSKEIPNLISPHLGDRVSTSWAIVAAVFSGQAPATEPATAAQPTANVVAALPLGGRIKIDPWNDQLRMLKSKPVGTVAESEKVPFEVTPFILYLTRQADHSPTEAPRAVAAAKTDSEPKP